MNEEPPRISEEMLAIAVQDASEEAKAVLVSHAKLLANPADSVSLVMLSTLELVGGMVGASLTNREPSLAKATLAMVDLYLPPLVETLRRRVKADDEAQAKKDKKEEKDGGNQDRRAEGDAVEPEKDDQLPPAEDPAGVAEPPVADGE